MTPVDLSRGRHYGGRKPTEAPLVRPLVDLSTPPVASVAMAEMAATNLPEFGSLQITLSTREARTVYLGLTLAIENTLDEATEEFLSVTEAKHLLARFQKAPDPMAAISDLYLQLRKRLMELPQFAPALEYLDESFAQFRTLLKGSIDAEGERQHSALGDGRERLGEDLPGAHPVAVAPQSGEDSPPL